MNFFGLIIATYTLLAIGVGFLWVVKLEYYIGAYINKAVFIVGCAVTVLSLFVKEPMISALIGVLGGTVIWGATELKDQEERVKRGMFKKNPKKLISAVYREP